MRVLHIGKFYYPYKGGMETVVRSLCRGLSEKNNHVEVLCYNDKSYNEVLLDGDVIVYKASTWGKLFSQPISLSYIFYFFKLMTACDIVHLHTPNPLATILLLLFSFRKKVVLTHHSDIYRQKLLKFFFRPIYSHLAKGAARIIVPTENHIKYSEEILNFQDKCDVIPFFLDKKFSEDVNINLSKVEQERPGDGFILFVGRLVEYKGLTYLLQSMINIDGQLVIIGSGPEKDNLVKMIKNLELEEKVSIKSNVETQEELMNYYRHCSMVVLPSISPNENFGMIQLEAMAMQKPVVTTNLKSGVSCVGIHEETCLIVEPKNVEQLSEAMRRLLDSKQLRKEYGQAGFKRYQKYFTENVSIDSHVAVYENILKAS